jgi:L-ascorbate metabolism protein UlaG (beta-lactamase superfamily)
MSTKTASTKTKPTELTWLGHGTWSIDAAGVDGGRHKLILDPFLDDSPTSPIRSPDVEADYILVSHGHFDHAADVAKVAQRTGATVLATFEVCEWFKQQGVKAEKVQPLNIGGGVNLPLGRVKMTIAHHSSTMPDGTPGGNPGGFLLTLADATIYFACDTGLFSDMRLIGSAGIDLAVLPIGDTFTMGPEDAVEATRLIQPRRVAPAHYNTWVPIAQDATAWAQQVMEATAAEPVVVQPGGKVVI